MLSIFMSHKICKNIPSFEIHRQKKKDRKEKQRRGDLKVQEEKKRKEEEWRGREGRKRSQCTNYL